MAIPPCTSQTSRSASRCSANQRSSASQKVISSPDAASMPRLRAAATPAFSCRTSLTGPPSALTIVGGPVGRAVVDDDELEVAVGLPEHATRRRPRSYQAALYAGITTETRGLIGPAASRRVSRYADTIRSSVYGATSSVPASASRAASPSSSSTRRSAAASASASPAGNEQAVDARRSSSSRTPRTDGGDERRPRRERLERHERQAFPDRREDDRVGGAHDRACVAAQPREHDAVGDSELQSPAARARACSGPSPRIGQPCAGHVGDRPDRQRVVLDRDEPAGGDDELARPRAARARARASARSRGAGGGGTAFAIVSALRYPASARPVSTPGPQATTGRPAARSSFAADP